MIRVVIALLVFATFLGSPDQASAEVMFALRFPDVESNTNQNWDDPTYGSLARATLQSVLDEVGREFAETTTIQLEITSSMTTAYAAGATTATQVLQQDQEHDHDQEHDYHA